MESRVILKTMPLAQVVEIAVDHAAGASDKNKSLEEILSGDTQHKRDKVVELLVGTWGYRHAMSPFRKSIGRLLPHR